ncbi:MAG: diacylglycerol kinase [Deltaproteobacteria bacterium]
MDDQREIIKPKNWLESLNCAIEGVIYAFRTQRHIRYHYVIATVVLVLSLFLRLPLLEFALFAISVVVLLFAEMFNTAMEEAVNLMEDKHNLMAKNAKDVSAGAVLISAIGVAVMAYIVFSRHLYGPMTFILSEARPYAGHVGVIALLLVLISVVVLKATTGRGRPLHGGMPSGHAAVAFSLFTSITLLTLDPLVSIMGLVLAVMVSQSRLVGGIHTRMEILLGSLLGSGLTLLIFRIFFHTVK